MNRRRPLSKEITSFLKLVALFFSVAFVFRIVFCFVFKDSSDLPYTFSEFCKAFYIGLKFDFRAALLLSVPFWLLGYLVKFVNRIISSKEQHMFLFTPQHATETLSIFFSILLSLYSLIFILDLGFYDYLQNRIDASATLFLANPLISFQMMNESYPMGLVFIFAIILLMFFFAVIKTLIFKENLFVSGEHLFRTSTKLKVLLFFVLATLAHGKVSQYPLRWSDAFFSPNNFISALGLNPVLYFFDTYSFKEKKFDIKKVKEHYPLISSYLGVENPNAESLNFDRTIKPTDAFDEPPHVVVIMMESLASFKLKHFGQKIDGAPFFDSLIPKSVFFENAYVPSTGTARSIFGVITGLPDVNSIDTASRNPLLVKQYSAVNGLDDYNKSYFIGGSANWGNIRGFISQNLKNVNLFEEKDFTSGKNDVWGISDLKLFREVNKYLKENTKSKKQFTFIQTAGYHRPYTIPKDRGDFKLKNLTQKQIEDNGFKNNEEFNSLRFSDYALQEFFKEARKEEYFKNTLFVIYADHGLSHYKSQSIKKGFKHHRLPIMHIPLLYYSESLKIQPQVISKIAFSPDILPSTVSLAGKSYINKTLGRNLFDEKYDFERYALTISSFSPPISLRLHNEEWITQGSPEKLRGLFKYNSSDYKRDQTGIETTQQKRMDRIARGLLETTKYLYHHSKD